MYLIVIDRRKTEKYLFPPGIFWTAWNSRIWSVIVNAEIRSKVSVQEWK